MSRSHPTRNTFLLKSEAAMHNCAKQILTYFILKIFYDLFYTFMYNFLYTRSCIYYFRQDVYSVETDSVSIQYEASVQQYAT